MTGKSYWRLFMVMSIFDVDLHRMAVRRILRNLTLGAFTLTLFVGLLTAPAQQLPNPSTMPHQIPGGTAPAGSSTDDDPMARHMTAQVAKSRNALRQQQLVSDTAKLLELANELKTEVDKSDKNTLSLAVVKKAEEIEKLAKSVRDRMRDAQ